MNDRLAVVLGTRPEIVKLAPVISALAKPPFVIHTGQHYDSEMAGVFFDAFGLEEPSHRLQVGGMSRAQQIGNAVLGVDELLAELQPAAVIAQGDTNSTVAAAIAANSRQTPMIHVEAGLRSHDRDMPEEHNRVVTDHLSDLCLAPTETSLRNLVSEGIPEERIVITGNTVVDALKHLLPDTTTRETILERHDVDPSGFVLSTFHRPENVDDPTRLQTIVDELAHLDMPVLLPVHPRTRAVASANEIDLEAGHLRPLSPIGYVSFLALLAECALVVADSGGLQEEVSVLKKPMIVVRKSTERPEVIGTFCSLVDAGSKISSTARQWMEGDPYTTSELARIPSPYGEGDSGQRSVAAIERFIDRVSLT